MTSKVISTIIPNDQAFAVNFDIIAYDKSIVSVPILDIWTDLSVQINQQDKYSTYLYLYHKLISSDTPEGISQQYYNTTNLWWLILLINQIQDPFDWIQTTIDNGQSNIFILKQQYIPQILSANTSKNLSMFLGNPNA